MTFGDVDEGGGEAFKNFLFGKLKKFLKFFDDLRKFNVRPVMVYWRKVEAIFDFAQYWRRHFCLNVQGCIRTAAYTLQACMQSCACYVTWKQCNQIDCSSLQYACLVLHALGEIVALDVFEYFIKLPYCVHAGCSVLQVALACRVIL